MTLQPVTLENHYVRLVPLSLNHLSALTAVGLDPEIWRWTTNLVTNSAEMAAYISAALQAQAQGQELPFTIIDPTTNCIAGSTRYGNIDESHQRLEIGWTWVAPEWQRTAINRAAKYLLLQHAFETLNFRRVEFKTDALNEKSRRALQGIGAKEEGILRQHMLTYSGRIRDSVYFSILASEWPSVKQHLAARLTPRNQ
jgi:N-acetyltransferase